MATSTTNGSKITIGDTHVMWRDSVPATSFPFRYKDKHHGVIAQTWSDVKEKVNREAVSPSMPFCTGHYAPSQLHNRMVVEMIQRDDASAKRMTRRVEQELASRGSSTTPQVALDRCRPGTGAATLDGPPPNRAAMRTTSRAMGADVVASLHQSRPSTAALTSDSHDHDGGSNASQLPLSSKPRPVTEYERTVLKEGHNGGKGRLEYLKLRRQLPVQQRFGTLCTSSQRYGWEQLDLSKEAVDETAHEAALRAARGESNAPPTREFRQFRRLGGVRPPPSPPGGDGMVQLSAASGTSDGTPPASDEAAQYFGRRSVMAQLTRPTGVFRGAD